jgi:CspA family cold shock protein
MVTKLVKGTVKFFNSSKGFGFINSEDGNDVFVHFSALVGDDDENKTLNENDEVEFDIVQGEKGPQANNVVVTKKAPPQPKSSGGYGGGGHGGGHGGGRGGGRGTGRSGGSRKSRVDRKGRSSGSGKRKSY